jgi:hypothetical protein
MLNQRLNTLRLRPDVRKSEYERDVEMFKNNEQIALAERKLTGELGISRDKILLEKERGESIVKIANNTIWRISLILIGFFILRHLVTRSKVARICAHQLREKAGPGKRHQSIDGIHLKSTTKSKTMNKEVLAEALSNESRFSCAWAGNVVQAETVHLKMSCPPMPHESPVAAIDDSRTNSVCQNAVCEASE